MRTNSLMNALNTWLHDRADHARAKSRIRDDYDRLMEMPDYLLADIGLSRSELVERARKARAPSGTRNALGRPGSGFIHAEVASAFAMGRAA